MAGCIGFNVMVIIASPTSIAMPPDLVLSHISPSRPFTCFSVLLITLSYRLSYESYSRKGEPEGHQDRCYQRRKNEQNKKRSGSRSVENATRDCQNQIKGSQIPVTDAGKNEPLPFECAPHDDKTEPNGSKNWNNNFCSVCGYHRVKNYDGN